MNLSRLLFHLVLIGNLEVIIVLLLLVFLRKLFGSLSEIDLTTSSASTTTDDVAGINLLHVVFIDLISCPTYQLKIHNTASGDIIVLTNFSGLSKILA
jgi:hypothetical protein